MKVVKFLVGLIAVGIILTVAVFLFVYIVIFAALLLGYLWWRTRTLRKVLRNAAQSNAQQHNNYQGGYVIAGEVTRENDCPMS